MPRRYHACASCPDHGLSGPEARPLDSPLLPPSLGSHLEGSLVLIAAGLGFGAYRLRRWIVPEFSRALARLAELVFGTTRER